MDSLEERGITSELFDFSSQGIKTKIEKNQITQTGIVKDTEFTLFLSLKKWAGLTSPEQIRIICELFWQVYPQEYFRFGLLSKATTKVTIAVENEGYGIACASQKHVHIHDNWLNANKTDFDCLTHELAHVCQNGWDGDYCPGENSYMIERFADFCRYLYAFNDGYYNDCRWTLGTVSREKSYTESVRLWVWVDYFYGTKDNDIIGRLLSSVCLKKYTKPQWEPEGEAWKYVFAGSKLEGKTLTEVWDMYSKSEFAKLSTKSPKEGIHSDLLNTYPVREMVKERYTPGI